MKNQKPWQNVPEFLHEGICSPSDEESSLTLTSISTTPYHLSPGPPAYQASHPFPLSHIHTTLGVVVSLYPSFSVTPSLPALEPLSSLPFHSGLLLFTFNSGMSGLMFFPHENASFLHPLQKLFEERNIFHTLLWAPLTARLSWAHHRYSTRDRTRAP